MKITHKTYGTVVAFDSGSNHPIAFRESNVDKKLHRGAREIFGPLPNVPLAAKQTLLAETLRTGESMRKALGIPKSSPIRCMTEHMRQNASWTSIRAIKNKKIGQLLGIEIEYYPRNGENNVPKENLLCNVTHDGSLDSGGREIRKLTWADNSGRLSGLLALKIDGKVNKKCGLHVHVDARHLTPENGRLTAAQTYDRLLTLAFALKKLIPKSRRTNTYCRWRSSRETGERYCAINFCSYDEHGTIEFRCQGGSVNLVKIETWALLCQYLVDFASKPENVMPRSWKPFLNILPEPFRTWSYLRSEALYGTPILLNERTTSATSGVE